MSAADIFGKESRWHTYEGELRIAVLVGGIPKDADQIRAWLKARLEMGDAELQAVAEETIKEMGLNPDDLMTPEKLDELVDDIMAKTVKGNGFKQPNGELVWEGRCLKAALKEACNACYPGVNPWPGRPNGIRKGLASYFVERVEVVDRYLPLGRKKPDIEGEQRIKRVNGPQGKRSAINMVDICEDVTVSFTIKVLDDCIPEQLWSELWEYVETGGVGADRSRGDGRSELVSFAKQPVHSRSISRSNGKRAGRKLVTAG